jgi:hypothetical protein
MSVFASPQRLRFLRDASATQKSHKMSRLVSVVRVSVKRRRSGFKHHNIDDHSEEHREKCRLHCRLYARCNEVNESQSTYQELVCQSMEILPSVVSCRLADVDRQKVMAELTAAGPTPLQVQDQIDDDFRRVGLK